MTREEAITYLKVIWNRYKAEYEIERETLDAYEMAIEALSVANLKEEFESADAVQGEWIPCSERLPKEKARVLTYDTMGDVVFGQYDKGKWYWEAEACADYWAKNDGVIAWMPLPTPYKGGAE